MHEVVPTAGEADEQLSLDVYNEVWPHDRITMDEVRSFKASVPAHVDLLARIDGVVAGSAVAVVPAQRPDRVFALVTVLAGHRRRGAGTALCEAVSAWAGQGGRAELETPVATDDGESLAFAQRRGFVEERRELGVVLRLDGVEPPAVELPDGVEIVSLAERPELVRGMYEVACEAEPDIPGFEDDVMEPFEDWVAHELQGSGDSPEATFVAVAGDEVAGWAKFSLTAAQPTVAHHDMTAVRRSWRGRGVAGALKATQVRWALAHGYTELRTRNEERNEPIRRLNARFGYRPGIGRIYLVGPLHGATAAR